MQSKTFRLFVSSTFSDFTKEREILHKDVFPIIDKYASDKGFTFQAIDLRWGVNEEAQLDQKTLELCLDEVRACKHNPHPNFLILAGDRYGYIPLPYMIEQQEFDAVLNNVEIMDDKELLEAWYILDNNQLPASYVLEKRTDKYEKYEEWEKVEKRLREILQSAVEKANLNKTDSDKYFLSATEQEVIEGICKFKDKTDAQKDCDENIDKKYIYGYIRDISNPSGKYIDEDDQLQTKAKQFKENLQNILNEDDNIIESKFNTVEEYEESKLIDFRDYMIDKLKSSIYNQITQLKDIATLDREISEQKNFQQDKLKGFLGREKILKDISSYINNHTTTEPLVVYGPSGMGKSALIAKAIDIVSTSHDNIIFRFVGATANSTSIRNLLISIVDEMSKNNIIDTIDEYASDDNKFYEQIKNIFNSIDKDIVLFIDALDQLQYKEYLNWLPDILKNNFKLILSVLKDAKYQEDTHYYNRLNGRYSKNNFVDITQDSLEEVKDTIIINLLKIENRQLDENQTKYLLDKWKYAEYLPLYLKIAIEEVKHWRSGDDTQELSDGIENIIDEYLENLTEFYHHEKLLIQKVFGYIHASKDGLSEKELLDILSEDLEDEAEFNGAIINKFHEPIKVKNQRRDNNEEHILPISIWSRLNTQLKPFIIISNIDNQPLIKFFHRQFTSVIEKFVENDKIKFHTKLANYFSLLQDKNKSWDKRYHNLHMLNELPYQLLKAKDAKNLKNILSDIEFIGSIYNNKKQDEFRNILSKAPKLNKLTKDKIYHLESFFREKDHFLIKEKLKYTYIIQGLYQLALEDGNNSLLTIEALELQKTNKDTFQYLSINNRKHKFTRSGLETVIHGHTGAILGVTFLSNNTFISYSDDNTLKTWNYQGKILCNFSKNGHTSAIRGVLELDNNKILSYSNDNSIIIWNEYGSVLKKNLQHTAAINEVILLDCNTVVSCSSDHTLIIWSLVTEKYIQLKGHTDKIIGLFKLINNTIVSYSDDKTIKLWSVTGKLLSSIKTPKRVINAFELKYGKYAGYILSYSYDHILRIFDKYGVEVKILKYHTDVIWGAVELEDNKIFTFSDDMNVCIWDINTTKQLINPQVLKAHSRFMWSGIYIKNSTKIITCSDDRTLCLWDYNTLENIYFKGHGRSVKGLIEVGQYIVSYSSDNTIRVWNYLGKQLQIFEGHNSEISGIIALGNTKLLSYSIDGSIRIWIINENNNPKEGHKNNINGTLIDKNNIVSFSDDNTIRIWDEHINQKEIYNYHENYIFNIKIVNNLLISYSADSTIIIYDKLINKKYKLDVKYEEKLLLPNNKRLMYNFGRDKYPLGIIYLKNTPNTLLTYTYDNRILLWSYKKNSCKEIIIDRSKLYNSKKLLNNNRILIKNNQEVYLYKVKEQDEIYLGKLEHNIFKILELKQKEYKNHILVYSRSGRFKIFDLSNPGKFIRFAGGHVEPISGVIELEEGQLLSYSADGSCGMVT
jgi:WD40 repeat protein